VDDFVPKMKIFWLLLIFVTLVLIVIHSNPLKMKMNVLCLRSDASNLVIHASFHQMDNGYSKNRKGYQ